MWPFSKHVEVKEIEVIEEDIVEIREGVFDFVLPTDDGLEERHQTVRTLIKTRQEKYQDLREQLESFRAQAVKLIGDIEGKHE